MEIAGAAIAGDIATPVQIEFQNSSNDSTRVGNLYIGRSAQSLPSPASLSLSPESMSIKYGTFNTYYDAVYQGGALVTWTLTGESTFTLGSWNISSAYWTAFAGTKYRIMGTLPSGDSNVQIKIRVLIEKLSALWESDWIPLSYNFTLQELCTVNLPPYKIISGDAVYPLDIQIQAKTKGNYAHSVSMDALYLMPAERWKSLKQKGYGASYGVTIVDDNPNNRAYSTGWSGGSIGNFDASGTQITLVPGKTNRLYFMSDTWTGSALANRTANIKVGYRPRYLSL